MAFNYDAIVAAINEANPDQLGRILSSHPGQNLNALPAKGCPPLFSAVERFSGPAYNADRYKCQLLLLAAGADPYQVVEAPSPVTPFLCALENYDLVALRLMLMAKPPYSGFNVSARRDVLFTIENTTVRTSGGLSFLECLQVTAKASADIESKRTEAERLIISNNLTKAAYLYEIAAATYAAQIKLENELIYPLAPRYLHHREDNSADSMKAARRVAIYYYQDKKKECDKRLYSLYVSIDEALRNQSGLMTSTVKLYHMQVLDRIMVVGKELGFNVEETSCYLEALLSAEVQAKEARTKISHPPEPPAEIRELLSSIVFRRVKDSSDLRRVSSASTLSLEEGEDSPLLGPARPPGDVFTWFGSFFSLGGVMDLSGERARQR